MNILLLNDFETKFGLTVKNENLTIKTYSDGYN